MVNKDKLYQHVKFLTEIYPCRNYGNLDSLNNVADYIQNQFSQLDCLLDNQTFIAGDEQYRNVIASFGVEYDQRLEMEN